MRHFYFVLFSLSLSTMLNAQVQVDSIGSKSDTIAVDSLSITLPGSINDSLQVETLDVSEGVIADSMKFKPITLTHELASHYLQDLLRQDEVWRPSSDSVKQSISLLVNHYFEPYDSIKNRLLKFPFDSVSYGPEKLVVRKTIPIKWLNETTFMVDTFALEKEPFIRRETVIMQVLDSESLTMLDTVPDLKKRIASLLEVKDTITEVFIDTSYLKLKRITLHRLTEKGVYPSVTNGEKGKTYWFSADSSSVVISKTQNVLMANAQSPFYTLNSPRMIDSIRVAIESLIDYTYRRDSILIKLSDGFGHRTQYWLTSNNDDLLRFWVKNSKNDSITIWLGNPAKHDISLKLEEDINVKRLEKKPVDDLPFIIANPNRQLVKLKPLKEIPILWCYGITSSYSLNENYFSKYWAQGGESSLTSMLDISAQTEYNNKESKLKWATSGRLRYGTTWTTDQGFRTSTDIVEVNSQYNRVLRDKIDFSSILYMKSQVAKGYNYPNDSVIVSKFLNPGAITIGVGMEFKPNKKTSINFSPLSYRNTFVLDTANINQTAHGIDADKRTKQEMGGQLLAKNTTIIFKDMEIKNTVRLFSSYLNNPQNIDVDWEMSVEKQISVYFKIRLNLHLIYDDDILFPLVNDNDEPILLPDGSPKKGPRAQFNQLLGLTLVLKI